MVAAMEVLLPSHLRHVDSTADYASRGMRIGEQPIAKLWWEGPPPPDKDFPAIFAARFFS